MNKKEKKIIILLIIGLIALDQIIKIITINKPEVTINNESKDNISYILISIIAIIILIRYILNENSFIKRNSRILISFAISGAASNVIDRIWNGQVINYITIPHFTSINLAYIYITITWIGMAIILSKYSFDRIQEKRKVKNENYKNKSNK